MTLAAAILLLALSSLFPLTSRALAQAAPPASQEAATVPSITEDTQQPQTKGPPEEETKSAAPGTPTKPAVARKKSRSAKATHHKKKTASINCDPGSSTPTSPSANQPTSPTGSEQRQGAGNSPASTDCPPPKIIVRHGGITEQSIQLAGGSGGDQATQKRDATNQMIATTEGNLKKIDGRQLSAPQKETVAQIRQFVVQSRSALTAGDLERAQTLAWKAKLLSDDLVNPKQ